MFGIVFGLTEGCMACIPLCGDGFATFQVLPTYAMLKTNNTSNIAVGKMVLTNLFYLENLFLLIFTNENLEKPLEPFKVQFFRIMKMIILWLK